MISFCPSTDQLALQPALRLPENTRCQFHGHRPSIRNPFLSSRRVKPAIVDDLTTINEQSRAVVRLREKSAISIIGDADDTAPAHREMCRQFCASELPFALLEIYLGIDTREDRPFIRRDRANRGHRLPDDGLLGTLQTPPNFSGPNRRQFVQWRLGNGFQEQQSRRSWRLPQRLADKSGWRRPC